MAEISRVAVSGKLNPQAYKFVEGATVFCKLRGNPYVELEHWISQIVQGQDTDWHRILRHYNVDAAALGSEFELIVAALGPSARATFWREFAALGRGSDRPAAAVLEALVRAARAARD